VQSALQSAVEWWRQATNAGLPPPLPHGAQHNGRRCSARCKRSGERYRRFAIPGGAVCVMHGGAAVQTARAARQRLLTASRGASFGGSVLVCSDGGMRPFAPPTGKGLRLAAALERLRRRGPGSLGSTTHSIPASGPRSTETRGASAQSFLSLPNSRSTEARPWPAGYSPGDG
jgi:hypothetical protein